MCIENKKTHFVFNKLFFFENRVIYEMRNNVVETDKTQMIK